MNRTVWIIIAAICILGLGGLIAVTKKDSINVDHINPAEVIHSSEDSLGDNVYGKKDAKVVVVEYTDFQCPGCAAANQSMALVKEQYKDHIAFVFRNFPLTQGHPNALAAATAAEAAGMQGKYWEMSDLLFQNREQWVNLSADKRGEMFSNYANQISLNSEQFKSDLSGSKVQTKIKTDRAIAAKIKVTATPSFFINNKKVDGPVVEEILSGQTENFLKELDQALKEAGETPPSQQ